MRRILFITGTRADYGKMKPLMKILEASPLFKVYIYVCGMHLLRKFGNTYLEVINDGYSNVYVAYGLAQTQNMSINLGNTIISLTGYIENIVPDMIIVHGDRMDALAGAVVGALHNKIVAHIEGGELSGTIDESTRHAISKFAHIHFVCTDEAKKRLIQLGEDKDRIYVIGSPDIDIMLSDSLPSLNDAKARYEIGFEDFGILMYHPVTTEYAQVGLNIKSVVDAVIESNYNYIVVYPNNDLGSEIILNEYQRLKHNSRFKIYPSLRFEFFLTFLKNAKFIIGNSSAGIREAGVYGIPAIDIGTRQEGRYITNKKANIQHVYESKTDILSAISHVDDYRTTSFAFGGGNSTNKFLKIIENPEFWNVSIQKRFIDYDV